MNDFTITKINRFKTTLKNEALIGSFFKATDPAFVEAAGKAGLNFAILDMEHGPADIKVIENLVRAAETTGMLSIVRTASNEAWMIAKALDTGASGVQVPNISNLEEAERAIQAARFHPIGQRGVCRFVRAAEYGEKLKEKYFRESNESLLILMVEGKEGLEQVEEILKLRGFDILFIGPYDLSQSLGIPGDINNPLIKEQLVNISKLAREAGKYVGTFYDEMNRKDWLLECDIRFLAYSVDTEIFRQACEQIKKQ